MAALQNPLALLGRLLIAALFIPAGIAKIGGFVGTAGYIASKGLPLPEVGVVIAIVIEVAVAAALLLGYRTRWAALLLAVFTLVAAAIFHNYWALPQEQQMMQQLLFTKNMAIVGGLLAFMAFGAGTFSLDARRRAA